MKIAHSTVIIPDHPVMRAALGTAEAIWKLHGRIEGITITSGKDGIHGASSWHYCGAAVDIRTNYVDNREYFDEYTYVDYSPKSKTWNSKEKKAAHKALTNALPDYDVILYKTHIHIETGNKLAKKWGLLL